MSNETTYEKLKRLRKQQPFVPFTIRNEKGEEADVTDWIAFAFTEDRGCAYASDGRWIRYRLDTVEIQESETAAA